LETVISTIIALPFIVFLLWAMTDPRSRNSRTDEAAGFVHSSDKLAKIERAQKP
jgi:hypothetical protein